MKSCLLPASEGGRVEAVGADLQTVCIDGARSIKSFAGVLSSFPSIIPSLDVKVIEAHPDNERTQTPTGRCRLPCCPLPKGKWSALEVERLGVLCLETLDHPRLDFSGGQSIRNVSIDLPDAPCRRVVNKFDYATNKNHRDLKRESRIAMIIKSNKLFAKLPRNRKAKIFI